MRVQRVDPANIDPAVIAEAAAILRRGGLVAFPTETVYGLGADATNASAVSSIFVAKGRPSYNPLIVHVSDVTAARRCVTVWTDAANTLSTRFWPGPLTIVLPKDPAIPDIVTAGLPTVGIRIPGHPVALALIAAADRPIAAPSANKSMEVSPTSGKHVATSLGGAPEMILDAGPSSIGIESTVIDLSGDTPIILRPGMISREALQRVLGRPIDVASSAAGGSEARPSPGMLDRHYSPSANVIVTMAPGADAVEDVATRAHAHGARVVVLARSPVTEDSFAVWPMPELPSEYARLLYATLHRVDAEGYDTVVIEALPDGAAWAGLRDRVTRAAR